MKADRDSARCPGCGGSASNNWFDRTLCACDAMHTCCLACGYALDGCPYELSDARPEGASS